MSHAVYEHQLSSDNRRGCILPTSRENQQVICPVYHESRYTNPGQSRSKVSGRRYRRDLSSETGWVVATLNLLKNESAVRGFVERVAGACNSARECEAMLQKARFILVGRWCATRQDF